MKIWGFRRRWLVGAVAAAIVALGLAAVLGSALGGFPPSATEHARAVSQPVDHVPALVQYQDPMGRFAVSYPQDWSPLPSSDPQVALLVSAKRAPQDSLLVRIVSLPQPINPTELADAKKITDKLVRGSDIRVLAQRQTTLNGLPGYYYLYTFGKPGSGRFGIHAHYFLFRGSTMYVLVFQALAEGRYGDLATLFGRMARSYRVPPAPLAAPAVGVPAPATPADPGPGG